MPRKIWFTCISWLCCFAVFSQEKMLLTKKLVWRKTACSFNNAEIVSLGSSRHGEKSKLKYAFMLLYYSTLSPSRDWCNCELHRVYGLCGLSRRAKLSFHLVQKHQGYFSLVLFWGSSHRYIDGEQKTVWKRTVWQAQLSLFYGSTCTVWIVRTHFVTCNTGVSCSLINKIRKVFSSCASHGPCGTSCASCWPNKNKWKTNRRETAFCVIIYICCLCEN